MSVSMSRAGAGFNLLLVGCLAWASSSGCASIRSAGLPGTPVEVFLVEVTDIAPDGPVRLVSVSTLDVIYEGQPLPPRPGEGDVAEMRRAAARHGAELLVFERVDNRYRHAYYGFGYVRDRSAGAAREAPVPCAHPDGLAARAAAAKRAASCLGTLKSKRAALAGRLGMVFQVDAHGDVYRAAATPASSRDTQVQQCGMKAIFSGSGYGAHGQMLCTLEIAATL